MTRRIRSDSGHDSNNMPHRKGNSGRGKKTVVILEAARKEGRKILTPTQYDHVVSLLKRLVDFGDPEELADMDIRPIEHFYELRDKGGPLGRINLRIYFDDIEEFDEVVVVKAYKKEQEGKTPPFIVIGIENRLETYRQIGRQRTDTVHKEATSHGFRGKGSD